MTSGRSARQNLGACLPRAGWDATSPRLDDDYNPAASRESFAASSTAATPCRLSPARLDVDPFQSAHWRGTHISCSCDGVKDSRVSLDATRKALGAIRDFLLHFVSGAEVCLEHREIYLAMACLRTVVTTVVALNRALTPEIATGVLDGLLADSGSTAVFLQRGLGFTRNDNMKCDIKTGTPIGSSSCVAQTDSTCYTLDSGSGCGGPSGFRFVWEIAS